MGFLDKFIERTPVFRNLQAKLEGSRAKTRRLLKKEIQLQLFRFSTSISSWKQGITDFEDTFQPTNEELIRSYNDAVIDSHLSALIGVRKDKVLSKDYKFVDSSMNENEETTLTMSSQWFRDCMSYYLDSIYFGYSLIHFGDRVDQSFEEINVIDREYVYPQEKIIRDTPSAITGKSWENPIYRPWVIEAGKPTDPGLLLKAVPMTIFKKSAMASWGEFGEIFGNPLRVGKTNVRDETLRDNMFDMLAEMGSSAFAVLDKEDEIDFVQATRTDAYQVFNMFIDRCNSEMSKLIIGSTMILDDGSSRSQSEVHERVSDNIVKSDAMKLEEWVNKCLVPHLVKYHGFTFLSGLKFMFDDTEVVSLADQFERDFKLAESNSYKVPASYMTEKYGTPLEEVEDSKDQLTQEQFDNVKNLMDKNKIKSPYIEVSHELINELLGGEGVGKSIQPKGCGCSTENEVSQLVNVDNVPRILTEDEENALYSGIYEGSISVEELPVNLYFATGERIFDGMREGIEDAEALSFGQIPDENFQNALRGNAFRFSGAKTFQQVKEMSDILAEGVSFADFKKEATKIFNEYNVNYLRAEFNHAKSGAQMASKWQAIADDSDTFPYLQYLTQADGRVREDHRPLDEIIRPVSDVEFWSKFYPPNGWNCRCDVIRLSEAQVTSVENLDIPEPETGFDFNVGINREIFNPEHPYFIIDDQFSDLARRNFDLPLNPGNDG